MISRLLPPMLLLTFLAFPLQADTPLDDFRDKSLELTVITRVLEDEESVVWHVESNEVTISGETVTVKLNGESVKILAEITPYILDDGSILLIARGDVLLVQDGEEYQYKTTLKSLPVSLGEKAFFFPLGVAFDSEENIYTIQLEIQVDEATHSYEETSPRS
ncbi:MAG: hypothetical protein JW760_11340 [Spirochaetales bacterium]|nr:hypothetical protein [Spirochaetales bacterium]